MNTTFRYSKANHCMKTKYSVSGDVSVYILNHYHATNTEHLQYMKKKSVNTKSAVSKNVLSIKRNIELK